MLPDTGERYLSTPLFEDIPAEMTEEEVDIAQSTPRFRFDAKAPPPPPVAESKAAPPPVSPEADAFVEKTITDRDQPVVMFALEWCEFCWSVRKLFQALDIPYRSVDLDSAAYQKDNWGGRIRTVLNARTGQPTIPQIFVGGEHIGGCTETFEAISEGRLQKLLAESRVAFNPAKEVDAYAFLPKWLHPRH